MSIKKKKRDKPVGPRWISVNRKKDNAVSVYNSVFYFMKSEIQTLSYAYTVPYLLQQTARCVDVDNAAYIPADTLGSVWLRSRPSDTEQSPAACGHSSVVSFPPSPRGSYPETADLQPGRSLIAAPSYTEMPPGAAEMPTAEPSLTACILNLGSNIQYKSHTESSRMKAHWTLPVRKADNVCIYLFRFSLVYAPKSGYI